MRFTSIGWERGGTELDHILKERDRLLQGTARIYGLGFAGVALLCLLVPDAVAPATYLPLVPLFVALVFAQYRIGLSRSYLWILLEVLSVLGIDSDRLFPVEGQVLIAKHVPNNIDGTEATVISSNFGHDGFLIEDSVVGAHLARLLSD